MKRLSISFIFMFSICLLFTVNAFSADKIRMAVMTLENKNVDKITASSVTDMVITEIVNTRAFDVVEREQINNILKEQGLYQVGLTDQSSAVKIGKLLSAQKILIGSVSMVGETYVINVRMVDVEKGVADLAAMEKAGSERTLPEAAKRIAKKVAEKLGFVLEEEEPFTMDGYYMRGIIPGWGQVYSDNRTKGYFFMGSFFVAGALSVYGYMDYNKKNDEYMSLPTGTPQSVFDEKNDAKKKAGLFAFSMITITGLIYVANWCDLLFINETPEVITSEKKNAAGDVFFDAGIMASNFYIDEKEYRFAIGLRF